MTPPPALPAAAPALRCLWLARALPFPQDSGDRIYSARLARALADSGCDVHLVGLAAGPVPVDDAAPRPPGAGTLRWDAVGGGAAPTWRALLSPQPLNGAIHATPAYRRRLAALLAERWDLVVLDHYGMGWALPQVLRSAQPGTARPVVVHVAHNHETTLWQDMVRLFRGAPLRRLGLWQNLQKLRRVEQRLATSVDLLCCITAEDAAAFARTPGARPSLVLTPGFGGLQLPDRTLTPATPRRVVMVGSFRWVAKQENLRALVQQADRVFAAHGIGLDVVGDVPAALRAELAGCTSATLHGFVEDIAPLFRQARLAIVPEVIGGGFKLKFLDYVFGRVAVVTLDAAAAGLPPEVRAAMLGCADLDALVDTVVRHIDALAELDRRQRQAHAAAAALFHWPDRGVALRDAVLALAPAATAPAPVRAA
ncbi:glycosyltransferase [Rubrivivax sp. RP6-9]|uniref:glycosyltransferase n=1 Tax=Rubrivivax sp. RP6-9 TaxID=3415750 RepID=UPI003CC51D7F